MGLSKICVLLGLVGSTLSLISACSLHDIKEESEKIESRSTISGVVAFENSNTKPVYARLYEQKSKHVELINQVALNADGTYQFYVLPGTYLAAAYIDQNNNQQYERDEPAIYAGHQENKFDFNDIQQKQHFEHPKLIIKGPIQKVYDGKQRQALNNITQNIGKIVTLDDPMFGAENASLGLWQPLDFIQQVGGGLLMLQEYDKTKTPVIFVHGIMGNPLEFKVIIEKLNRDKFQPWVLYYPSGVRLDMVSDYFLNALNQLQNIYGFSDVQIIAHSMGGLMSRSLLMKQQVKPSFDISLFVTINSPLYGMDGAASGVKHSPIVIPSWRDVASGSDYVKRVHDWRLPADIPYHLIFSYLKEEDGDGVVPLSSQLSQSLQDEAIKIYGFNAQHAGILKMPELATRINKILANPEMKTKGN